MKRHLTQLDCILFLTFMVRTLLTSGRMIVLRDALQAPLRSVQVIIESTITDQKVKAPKGQHLRPFEAYGLKTD